MNNYSDYEPLPTEQPTTETHSVVSAQGLQRCRELLRLFEPRQVKHIKTHNDYFVVSYANGVLTALRIARLKAIADRLQISVEINARWLRVTLTPQPLADGVALPKLYAEDFDKICPHAWPYGVDLSAASEYGPGSVD